MHRLTLRLRDERGIALVLALMVLTVLTISLGTTIVYSTQSQHESHAAKTKSYAYVLAENGINNAMSVLRDPPDIVTGIGNNALDKNVFCGFANTTYVSPTPSPCTIKQTYDGGSVVWSGVLNQSTATWTLTSTGSATSAIAGTSDPTRTLTVYVPVHPTLTQPLNTPVWNYIYSTNGPSAVGVCDMDLNQSVTISSPLYVEGNLCLHNTAHIISGPLVVKGRLTLDSATNNYVGTSAVKLSDAHIANGCTVKNTTHTPCQNNGVDNLYATTLDATAPVGLVPPTPNWTNWYINGSPGPYFPCTTIAGTPPTFDTPVDTVAADTDAQKLVFKNNNMGVQDLTPGASYTCRTAGGELSWNNTTKQLTIHGTVFIDGSAVIQNGSVNTYVGQGVIYLSGTLLIKNSSLCGAVYAGACDMRTLQQSPAQGWDPNTTLICFVAQGSGGQVSAGDSIQLVSSTIQGAAYATYALDLGTTSNVDGPLVGAPVMLGQSVTTSFPSITIVPDGMPSNPTAYAQADSPTNYAG
jgi:Tfp pilus assembly protein PilX